MLKQAVKELRANCDVVGSIRVVKLTPNAWWLRKLRCFSHRRATALKSRWPSILWT